MYLREWLTKEKRKELGLFRMIGECSIPSVDIEIFKNMSDEEILKSRRNIGEERAKMLAWVRDYLNGKVEGKYTKPIIDEYKVYEEKINTHIQNEDKLREELRVAKSENAELKRQLREYQKECQKKEAKYQKAREMILSIE